MAVSRWSRGVKRVAVIVSLFGVGPLNQIVPASAANTDGALQSLRDAYGAYTDANTPRTAVIPMFESFVADNPESPFIAEIHFCIAAMYTMDVKVDLGERANPELGLQYFKMAHELYGDKYSSYNDCAWASVVNHSSALLSQRKEYYDWLQSLSHHCDPDDIWPVEDMRMVLDFNLPVVRTQARIARFVNGMGTTLEPYIRTAEKNILYRHRNDPVGLADLAHSYPDTSLGRLARTILDRSVSAVADGVVEQLEETGVLEDLSATSTQGEGVELPIVAANTVDNPRDGATRWAPYVITCSTILLVVLAFAATRRFRGAKGTNEN